MIPGFRGPACAPELPGHSTSSNTCLAQARCSQLIIRAALSVTEVLIARDPGRRIQQEEGSEQQLWIRLHGSMMGSLVLKL
jgi:hypothetical protein